MGDLSAEVDVESNDEIGDLADSFERMVAAVRFLAMEAEMARPVSFDDDRDTDHLTTA